MHSTRINEGYTWFFLPNQYINIVYPNENYPFVLVCREKKLDSCHERILYHFKDELWFQTKRRVEKVFKWNQSINIVNPKENYSFVFVCHENKLDSCQEWSLSCFKDELWFPIKQRVQMVSLRNQCINVMYPKGNYLFVLDHHEKKLDSCHEQS